MKKILLVEDDIFLQKLYTELLKAEKYDVTISADGYDALEKLLQGGWNLVLLDIMLPGMTGFEVFTSAKKKHGKNFSFPVVFMTNLDSSDDDKKKLQMSSDYWIKSNMSPPEFISKVKLILK